MKEVIHLDPEDMKEFVQNRKVLEYNGGKIQSEGRNTDSKMVSVHKRISD